MGAYLSSFLLLFSLRHPTPRVPQTALEWQEYDPYRGMLKPPYYSPKEKAAIMEEVKYFMLDGNEGRSVKIEEIVEKVEPIPDRGCRPGTVRPPALSFREMRRVREEIMREESERQRGVEEIERQWIQIFHEDL